MTAQVVRWPIPGASADGLTALLAAYHLRTEAEKGRAGASRPAWSTPRSRMPPTVASRAVRLSVWSWRTEAIALYERFGFTVAEAWDDRDPLVCMERTTGAPGVPGAPASDLL